MVADGVPYVMYRR